MTKIEQFRFFMEKCTDLSKKTRQNYMDHKRINICLQTLFPEKEGFTLFNINSVEELEQIAIELNKMPLYIEYNKKGNNQYSAIINTYLHFLYSLNLSNSAKTIGVKKKHYCQFWRHNLPHRLADEAVYVAGGNLGDGKEQDCEKAGTGDLHTALC